MDAALIGMVLGLATVSWGQPQTTGVAAEIAVSVRPARLWLVAVGMTAWALGYCIAHSRALNKLGGPRSGSRSEPVRS